MGALRRAARQPHGAKTGECRSAANISESHARDGYQPYWASELMRRVKNSQSNGTTSPPPTARLRAVLNALSRKYAELKLASASTTKPIQTAVGHSQM